MVGCVDDDGCILLGRIDIKGHDQKKRVYSIEGLCPTPSGLGVGGNTEPKVAIPTDFISKGSDNLTNINDVYEYKPFNYVSLFSGIGGFEQALNKLGGTCVMASEIDKYANQSYEILYGHPTVGDVTKIAAEDVPDHDLLVGGFPCQAFSVAGKRLGFDDTRGTLFFEIARIASTKQPSVLLLENVKGLISHDKGKTLDTIIQTLADIGYTVDFNVLNSKYFGVPQNRERIFIIAVRGDLIEQQPWQIEGSNVVAKGKRRISEIEGVKTFNFDWPAQCEVTTRLRDILEDNVDEKYYLSEEKTAKLVAQLEERTEGLAIKEATTKGYAVAAEGDAVNFQFPDSKTRRGRVGKQIAQTLEASGINQGVVEPQMLGHIDLKGHDAIRRVDSTTGVSPTLTTMGGGHREPKIAEEVRPVLTPDRIEKRQNGRRFKDNDEESFTLTAQDRHGVALSDEEVLNGEEKERNTFEILRLLLEENGEETLEEWRTRVLNSFQSQEILQQGLYGESIYRKGNNGQSELVHGTQTSEVDTEVGDLREVRINRECGCAPQRRGLAEQFSRELTIIVSELSHKGTSTEEILCNMWETTQGSRVLQQTLYQIQEVWRSNVPKTRYRIRKLTPRETFRLQGFPDSEFDKLVEGGISNSQLYKQAGNAVTVNVISAIGKRLITYLN